VLLRYPKPTLKPRLFAKTVCRRNLGFFSRNWRFWAHLQRYGLSTIWCRNTVEISTRWVGCTNVTDDRHDGWATKYSERKLTFTFATNDTLRPFRLLELSVVNSGHTFVFVIKVSVNDWWELLTISITFWGLHYWSVHSFFVFECVIENVCGCLSFELEMMKVIPYDPSHEEVYIAFIMKT